MGSRLCMWRSWSVWPWTWLGHRSRSAPPAIRGFSVFIHFNFSCLLWGIRVFFIPNLRLTARINFSLTRKLFWGSFNFEGNFIIILREMSHKSFLRFHLSHWNLTFLNHLWGFRSLTNPFQWFLHTWHGRPTSLWLAVNTQFCTVTVCHYHSSGIGCFVGLNYSLAHTSWHLQCFFKFLMYSSNYYTHVFIENLFWNR